MTEQDRQISEIVAEERSRLRNFIRRRVPDPADVEDIVQEVFYELVEANRLLMPIDQVTVPVRIKPFRSGSHGSEGKARPESQSRSRLSFAGADFSYHLPRAVGPGWLATSLLLMAHSTFSPFPEIAISCYRFTISCDMRSVPPRGSGWVGFAVAHVTVFVAQRNPPATAWWY